MFPIQAISLYVFVSASHKPLNKDAFASQLASPKQAEGTMTPLLRSLLCCAAGSCFMYCYSPVSLQEGVAKVGSPYDVQILSLIVV